MSVTSLHETLSRTVKMAVDSGEAGTFEEAKRIFEGYRLLIEVGPEIAASPTFQAALLTAVNTARRCFLGGVYVQGALDARLLVPWGACETLVEAVSDLRGTPTDRRLEGIPRVVLGSVPNSRESEPFGVRATFDGWSAGVMPLVDTERLPEAQEFTPSGVFAGAAAVSEAFQYVRGGTPMAGQRRVGLSLWQPHASVSWLDRANIGPATTCLPSSLWLLGLGHLGQAFLWTLGFLPYANPEEVHLVLQDFDHLSVANDSTSPLTFAPVSKVKKARAMAQWCEGRGFRTSITERAFTADLRLTKGEPTVALCGVDNPDARADLEEVGFSRVVEAGLGKGGHEYLAFQIHTFPGPQKARERWNPAARATVAAEVRNQPAYQGLARQGLDECGLTTLAGRSVGACFVGTAVSTLVIAEVLRMAIGGPAYGLVDGTLRSLDRRSAIENPQWAEPFNPGFTSACS